MKIRKKAAGIAFTATLLSALIATVAAPLALASVSVTSAGAIPKGGTSATPAAFTLTENSANCFGVGANAYGINGGYIEVAIADFGGSTANVSFTGAALTAAPGSLGATVSSSANLLIVKFTGHDDLNMEQVIESAKITATSTAAAGAVSASLVADGTLTGYTNQASCVLPSTATASGHLTPLLSPYPIGSTAFSIALDAGSCDFQVTGGSVGQLNFVTNAESKNVTVAPASVAGNQNITTAPTANAHFPGEAVNQTVLNCSIAIASPGTVTSAFTLTGTTTVVNPGENSQPTGTATLADITAGPGNGILFTGETLTFAITNPATGVVFSAPFTVTPSNPAGPVFGAGLDLDPATGAGHGAGAPVQCSLSVDRHFCSVVVQSDVAGDDSVVLSGMMVDVDATVPLGTAVKLTVTPSPAIVVSPVSVTIAFVGRVIVSTGAQPTIYIGFNDQPTGTITLVESGPGFFVAGLGGNNTFGICLVTGESFTRAPWAVVTVGDLKILSGVVGVTQLKGTLFTRILPGTTQSCAYWTIYSASTVASTIEIRGSADDVNPLPAGPNNGPRLSVPAIGFGATPGSSQADLEVGTLAQVTAGTGFSTLVSNAIRAFKNSFAIAAASQPICPPGSQDCLGGNITVTETQNGQLKPGDLITVRVLPRSSTQRQDVILKTGNTNDLPIITANTAASGLLVTPVGVNCPPSSLLGTIVCQFTFSVTQQSFGPTLGQITVSNIHYITSADAILGPVNIEVTNTPGPGGQSADTVISNVTIGNPAALTKVSAASAVTKTQNAASFSVGTKVVNLVASSNNIVTIRLKLDPALVGKSIQIQVATKTGSVWSSFVTITSRVVGSDGYAYYYATAHSAKWLSFRGNFAGTPQWLPSHSQTVQVRWL